MEEFLTKIYSYEIFSGRWQNAMATRKRFLNKSFGKPGFKEISSLTKKSQVDMHSHSYNLKKKG